MPCMTLFHKEIPMDKIITLLMIVVAMTAFFYTVFSYLQLPEVGITDDTGKCVWIRDVAGAGIEKKKCPMVLPDKYITTIVRGNP